MSHSCNAFRASLADALRGHPAAGLPSELSWHAHLLGCEACRSLLEAEEALEEVLATLPDPKLPPGLAERVLVRLGGQRADGLDRLLDLDTAGSDFEAGPGPGLPSRLLEGLNEARREAALDVLLESVPAPRVPTDLHERVLAKLEPARRKPVLLFPLSSVARVAAAVLVALGLGFTVWKSTSPEEPISLDDPLAAAGSGTGDLVDTDLELLRALDLLENWDLLTSDDLDVQLAEIDSLEAELIEIENEFLTTEGEERG